MRAPDHAEGTGPTGTGPHTSGKEDGGSGSKTDASPVMVADHPGIGAHPERVPAWPRFTGCPCGHDPDRDDECVRHRRVGRQVDYLDAPIWWDGRLTDVRHAGTEAA